MPSPINLLVCGNGGWSAHIATTLMSAVQATPDTPVRLLVGATEIDAVERERVQSAVPENPITWIDVSLAELDALPSTISPKYSLIELLAINRLPADVERLLTIDADTIVRHDLTELWNVELAGCTFAAARDPWQLWIGRGIPYFAELGLDGSRKYLQSGVKVVDMPAWRGRNIHERAFDHLDRWHHSMRYSDQDMLNAIIGDDWRELPLRWNAVQNSINELTAYGFTRADLHEAIVDPGIIHFAGGKPWNWSTSYRDSIAWLDTWEQFAFNGPYRDWYAAERARGLGERAKIRPQRRSLRRRLRKAASVLLRG